MGQPAGPPRPRRRHGAGMGKPEKSENLRGDGRAPGDLRPTTIEVDSFGYGEGSALIRVGGTAVLCVASVEPGAPPWMRGEGRGWVTGEYSLLPRSTGTRNRRERSGAGGRTQEIQRLIGRALRAAVDLTLLGERTVTVDCDVLQADGGTRTAAITGGYVALADAIAWLQGRKRCKGNPLIGSVAAVSVGIVAGQPRLDLCYEEDVAAQTDMNVVCTGDGSFVEVQGTAEQEPFSRQLLNELLDLAVGGCAELTRLQQEALAR